MPLGRGAEKYQAFGSQNLSVAKAREGVPSLPVILYSSGKGQKVSTNASHGFITQ